MFARDIDKRTAWVSMLVTVILWMVASRWGESGFATGIIWGGFFSTANLFLWRLLIVSVMEYQGRFKNLFLLLAGIGKFPVFYGAGYIALTWLAIDIKGVLAGLTVPFLVLFLKSLSLALGFGKERSHSAG